MANIVVNGSPVISKTNILASIRTQDDGPDLMWKLGYHLNRLFGSSFTNRPHLSVRAEIHPSLCTAIICQTYDDLMSWKVQKHCVLPDQLI